jgi:hypothetical protein
MRNLGSMLGRDKGFSLLHSAQTGSRVHPASHTMDTHLHLVPRLRTVELYLHCFISLHGVVLN